MHVCMYSINIMYTINLHPKTHCLPGPLHVQRLHSLCLMIDQRLSSLDLISLRGKINVYCLHILEAGQCQID